MENNPDLKYLISSAQSGDEDTFRVLYGIFSPRVFKFIRPRARNRADALDILQETFIDFWKSLPKFSYQGDKEMEAFLYRIATRKLSKSFRFWKRFINLESVEDVAVDASVAIPGQALDVAYILATLKDKDREIIVLRDLEQRSFLEISQILRESENAVKVRHHRALVKIRKKVAYE